MAFACKTYLIAHFTHVQILILLVKAFLAFSKYKMEILLGRHLGQRLDFSEKLCSA